jgi:ABC-type antimicrobial peptide transport system permease subunit
MIYISGLTLGISCSLLIMLWVFDEMSYDKFHLRGDRIYQVYENQYWGDLKTSPAVPWPLAKSLKAEFPEISKAAVITANDQLSFSADGKLGKEDGIYATPDIFEIFSFPMVSGDYQQIASPSSIIIDEKIAHKYWGNENPIGKTIRVNNQAGYKVCAVMKDIPQNSSIQFDYVLPANVYEEENSWLNWGNHSFRTYVLLSPNSNVASVDARIKNLLRTKNSQSREDLFLQKFSDGYLYSDFKNGKPDGGRIEYVRLFSVVALLVLLIACINFMNLVTARAVKRAKEVGIRRVVGAGQRIIWLQFICEAIIVALISMLLSLVIIWLLLPAFNQMTNKDIHLRFYQVDLLVTFLGLGIFTGILSGLYPAFFLSHINPVRVLKGSSVVSPGKGNFRKGLVVFQFLVSSVLIFSTVIVHRQINYIKNKNLGINRDNILYLSLEDSVATHFDVFKQSLSELPGIRSVSASSQLPIEVEGYSTDPKWEGKTPDKNVTFAGLQVADDFLKTVGVKIVEGRAFASDHVADSNNYILNETAVRMMGLKDPIGKELTFWNGRGVIIGVMKDFHFSSLHNPIQPIILLKAKNLNGGYALLKIDSGKEAAAIDEIAPVWKQFSPNMAFDFHFLDEEFDRQYGKEAIIGHLANYFAFLAIFIACLGLFGLSVYNTQVRVKEIGIRKVLGASSSSIVFLIMTDSLRLVFISIVIAIPLSWWIMNKWLENFAYHVSVGAGLFILVTVLSICIAAATIVVQVVRAAVGNPIKAIKTQ